MSEKYATIEILNEGEMVFDSVPNGRYMVREYDGDEEMGAEFYESILLAEKHVLMYQAQSVCRGNNSNE
jgi:hypothetical protein